MKKILPLLLILITLTLRAQDGEELKEALKIHPDSVGLYQQLVRIQLFKFPTEARATIRKGLEVATASRDLEALADLHSKLGIWHDVHGGVADSVFYYFKLAQRTFKELKNVIGYADATNNLAYAYSRRSMFKQSLPLLQRALQIYDSLEINEKAANARVNIGIVYQSNNEVDKALKKYKEALNYFEGEQITPKNYRIFSNIATIYNREAKYDSAIAVYKQLINFGDSTGDSRGLAIYYNNIATSFMEKGNYQEALISSESSIKYKTQLKDTVGIVATLNTKATIEQKMGNPTSALSSANKGLKLNRKTNIPQYQLDLLKIVAETSKEIGNYRLSSESFKRYVSLKDSLDQEQKQKEILEISEKYESEQKERKILELEKNTIASRLSLAKSKNQRNIILLIATLILGLSIMLYRLYRVKSKSELTIAKSLQEKETLLKEIHHRVKNNLQIISSLLSMQSRFIEDEKALGAVNEGQSRVESMALIHQKLYQETSLSGVNAREYIEDLTEILHQTYATNTSVAFEYDIDNLIIDVDTIIPIGLILNELICNTLKHAFPQKTEGKIMVKLKEQQDSLRMEVADNGVGVNEMVTTRNSFGSILIESLAAKLKASLEIKSQNGMSTVLNITKYKLA